MTDEIKDAETGGPGTVCEASDDVVPKAADAGEETVSAGDTKAVSDTAIHENEEFREDGAEPAPEYYSLPEAADDGFTVDREYVNRILRDWGRDSGAGKTKQSEAKDKKTVIALAVCDGFLLVFIAVCLIISRITGFALSSGRETLQEQIAAPADAEETAVFTGQWYDPSAVFAYLTPSLTAGTYPVGINEKYKALYSMNRDMIGRLVIEGTQVDYMVVRADNNEKYYRSDFYGNYTIRGSFFLDYRNYPTPEYDSLSKNNIIYGHQMVSDGWGFTEIQNYKDLDYYKEHPVITFETIYNTYRFKVIGGFVANVYPADDGGHLFYFWDNEFSDAKTQGFAEEVKTRSYVVNPAVDILPGDKFLTLQTCCYDLRSGGDRTEGRFVVVARLVREGESAETDTSAAYRNTGNRMPQRYYDIHGLTNPYAGTPVWQFD